MQLSNRFHTILHSSYNTSILTLAQINHTIPEQTFWFFRETYVEIIFAPLDFARTRKLIVYTK